MKLKLIGVILIVLGIIGLQFPLSETAIIVITIPIFIGTLIVTAPLMERLYEQR